MAKVPVNPIIRLDYPDPDVIRVDDTYYMVSTTMHFLPGCALLRSYDLIHWELASYVYDSLEDTPGWRLEGEENIYGKGMWAPCIRWNKGIFYICFAANDTRKTYLFRSESAEGPWKKSEIQGFYHDSSLLFDDDGRVYIVYGSNRVWLTELETDLSGPKKDGLSRLIVSDEGNRLLGYEGSHIYKINGTYYVFFIHSCRSRWHRVEACFCADSLDGEFTGRDVLDDDLGYCGQGAAQGGIVDTPDGNWYGVIFQDRGASGRFPVLVPVEWKDGFPVFGEDGRVPMQIDVVSTRPDYVYEPLFTDDDFRYEPDADGRIVLKLPWQWNHRPDPALWSVDGKKGQLTITTGKLSSNLCQAVNTLTQRMPFPGCVSQVTVDGSGMKDGDYAGICALQGCYGMIALHRAGNRYELLMMGRPGKKGLRADENASYDGMVYERIDWDSPRAELLVRTDFRNMRDEAEFFYRKEQRTGGETESGTAHETAGRTADETAGGTADEAAGVKDGRWTQLGITQKLYFKMDHFCGCRAGLFCYSEKETGGSAAFENFRLRTAKKRGHAAAVQQTAEQVHIKPGIS